MTCCLPAITFLFIRVMIIKRRITGKLIKNERINANKCGIQWSLQDKGQILECDVESEIARGYYL